MGELMNCGVLRACGRLCVLRNELVGFFEWWVMGCSGSLTLREKKRTAQPTHWTMKQREEQPNHSTNHPINSCFAPLELMELVNGAEWVWWIVVLAALSLGGLWAGGPANAPHKERQAAANNTTMKSNEWSQRNEKINLMKLNLFVNEATNNTPSINTPKAAAPSLFLSFLC